MAFSNAYNYRDRNIFDIKTLISAIKFFIINAILAFIFLFLTLEELDWIAFSFLKGTNDKVIDITSWNIKNSLNLFKFKKI